MPQFEISAPKFSPEYMDQFLAKNAVLTALKGILPRLNGRILDIGCGNMPYRDIMLHSPSKATEYIGLDLRSGRYASQTRPDIFWDGVDIPLENEHVDVAIAIEVLEHCPNPSIVLKEAHRVLKPEGLMFLTVPFLWPLHDTPHDEYRYTPFALERLLNEAGFDGVSVGALGGWDASLAQMLALWINRRPMSQRKRRAYARFLAPIVRKLHSMDVVPEFSSGPMITALSAYGTKRPA